MTTPRGPGRMPRVPAPAGDALDRLFVYGTLRSGHAAHARVRAHVVDATPATVSGRVFALPEGYPGMLDGPGGVVVGELLRLRAIDAVLTALDEYEGDEYRRVVRPAMVTGGALQAWCYVLVDAASARRGVLVDSGDWLAWTRARTGP